MLFTVCNGHAQQLSRSWPTRFYESCRCRHGCSCAGGDGTGSLAAQAGDAEKAKPQTAETIYHGGSIVTMTSEGDEVEALAVAAGEILAVGTKDEIMKLKDDKTTIVDLKGKSLLPGFVDPHSHLAFQALKNVVVNLDPKPIGKIGNIKDMQEAFVARAKDTKKGDWLVGFGYDDTALEEMRHPTRSDLDKVSADHPIFAFHISMHMGVVNSKALELAGIDASTKEPEGGIIGREKDGKAPNGLFKEKALALIIKVLPKPKPENAKKIIETGAKSYASVGITTAHEGMTAPDMNALYNSMEANDQLPIDILSFAGLDKLRR